MNTQPIFDKLHTLELSALQGRSALSLGGVDEQGVRKLLARLAGHLHELTEMVGFLPEPAAFDAPSSALGELDTTAPARIWLQVDAGSVGESRDEAFPADHEGVTWCEDSIGGLEVPYVRADLAHGFLRPMASAPMDGTPVLLKMKPASDLPERLGAMADRWFVGANRNDASEWGFAAPVGYGGIPATRMVGWMPVPDGVELAGTATAHQAACPSAPRTAADAFLDFFRDRGGALFAEFGLNAVELYNAAQQERRQDLSV